MRLTSRLTLVLLLSACGDDGGRDPGNTAPTGNSASTTDGGTGNTAPTTGAPGTSTGEPVTTTSGSASSDTSSTTDPSASSSTGPVDPGTTTDPGTGSTTDPGTTGDTGVTPGGECVTDKDCALHNDCCDCFGIKAGEPDPICKKGCDTLTCDLLGIDQAVCRFGVCGTERVNCDPSAVLCKSLPPECVAGQVPGVDENGGCWTGQCVPALSCNVVPDCSACPADSMCVQKISKMQSLPTCEPVPAQCDGQVDCECAGDLVCTGDFNICNAEGKNQINCGCPVC